MTSLIRFLCLIVLLLPWSPATAEETQAIEKAEEQAFDPWTTCRQHVVTAEKLVSIPRHLLSAISSVESGRWSKAHQARISWPWTVMAEGKGRYLPSKAKAIAEVKALQARGIRNIDVGCMQINLHYHGDAFTDLEQAFDPAFNVAYAASFLLKLRQEQRSWTRAIGRYHSATPKYAIRYKVKVRKAWQEEKRAEAERVRAKRKALRDAARSKRADAKSQQQVSG
ncbi:transglycosylase SLT domain-containing protein [Rhodovibrionaceae bacterium A322]